MLHLHHHGYLLIFLTFSCPTPYCRSSRLWKLVVYRPKKATLSFTMRCERRGRAPSVTQIIIITSNSSFPKDVRYLTSSKRHYHTKHNCGKHGKMRIFSSTCERRTRTEHSCSSEIYKTLFPTEKIVLPNSMRRIAF